MRFHNIVNESTHQMDVNKFQHLLTPAVLALDKAVSDAGYEIRIVGGAVRDLVLGLDPKDIDMASDALPDTMMKILDGVGIRHEPTGLDHGTITAIIDGEPIEITTLRIDSETDGRHATVSFTNDWKQDAERRDLTFNAMSMDLKGTLFDYFDGIEDLKNGIAKFVGDADKRIQEDFLRILRFFRFQGRLNSPTWDKETMEAVRRNADGLSGISGERVWMEMSKILSRPDTRVNVIKLMSKAGVLKAINMPAQQLDMMRDVNVTDPVVALSTTLKTVDGLDVLKRLWKLSNTEYNKAKFILQNRHLNVDEAMAQRMLTDPQVRTEHVFALLAANGDDNLVSKLKHWTPPVFPVTGSDLIAAGVKPGPEMGKLLGQFRNKWEASGFKLTKTDLLKEL